jgi:intracellular sulfur oxidation DsrE/DsrF family protein
VNKVSYNRRAIIGGSMLAAGVATLPQPAAALAPASGAPWRAAMEPADAWLDKPGTRHRLVLDTSTAEAAEKAVSYVEGFYSANQSGYDLAPDSLGAVIVLRHFSTPFGYNDRIWSKYGPALADKLKLSGQNAIRAAHANPLWSAPPVEGATAGASGDDTPTLATLAAKGVRFAVCGVATAQLAKLLLREGESAATLEAELKANLVSGSVLVASGIVAVNRAQEHGYAFVSIVD